MLVFTLPLETLQGLIRRGQGRYFVLELQDSLELYSTTDEGIIFRAVYQKRGGLEDELWKQQNLQYSVMIQSIENVDRSREIFIALQRMTLVLEDIRQMIFSKNQEEEAQKEDPRGE